MRQWYKGMALQGICAADAPVGTEDPKECIKKYIGAASLLADAMIAEDKKAEEIETEG